MKSSNKIIVDLNKVTHARLQYVCHGFGITHRRDRMPTNKTVNNIEVDFFQLRYKSTETLWNYAERKELFDEWFPELELQLSNNHSLIYTGQKALDLWTAWRAKIFGGKK